MKNKELYKLNIECKKIIDVVSGEDDIKFVLEGEEITLSANHYQDCCENVWADFSNFNYAKNDLVGKNFKEFIIKGVEEIGFLVCFISGYGIGEKVLVPCYNEQNGYYSSDLELVVKTSQGEVKMDISGLVEDHID